MTAYQMRREQGRGHQLRGKTGFKKLVKKEKQTMRPRSWATYVVVRLEENQDIVLLRTERGEGEGTEGMRREKLREGEQLREIDQRD